MAPHSSTLDWKIPWTEEPGRLQSTGSRRVRHDWATSLSLFLSCIREGNGNPLQCSCLENPRDGGAWWAAVSGVPQNRARLKRLGSSSSNNLSSPRPSFFLMSSVLMQKPECHSSPLSFISPLCFIHQQLALMFPKNVLFSPSPLQLLWCNYQQA